MALTTFNAKHPDDEGHIRRVEILAGAADEVDHVLGVGIVSTRLIAMRVFALIHEVVPSLKR